MVSRKTKFWVGLFMAAGVSIAIVAVIWLGMSRVFEKGRRYAVYFDESVQGLSVDSPVKYRGVAIGRVEKIDVAPDSKLIEVVLKIEAGMKPENDMIAQLKVVGITGSMFVELDRGKDGKAPELHFPTEYPVLASRPSEMSELFRGIDEIVQKINMLDVAGISEKMKIALDDVDRAVVKSDLPAVAAELKATLVSIRNNVTPDRWQKILAGVEQAIANIHEITAETKNLIKNASGTVDKTGAGINNVNRQLTIIGRNLERSSDNLDRLLENLANQPSQLLLSEPPPRRFPD